MKPWQIGLAAGALTSAGLLFFLAKEKKAQLERKGQQLEQALMGGGEQAQEFQRSVAGMRSHLSAYAMEYAEPLALRAGDEYVARYYGLTPARMLKIERFVRTFGG